MLKRMMIHKAITRNQYVKPFILFEEIEQDMGLLNRDGASTGGENSNEGTGEFGGEDAKRTTFIFEEDDFGHNNFEYDE